MFWLPKENQSIPDATDQEVRDSTPLERTTNSSNKKELEQIIPRKVRLAQL